MTKKHFETFAREIARLANEAEKGSDGQKATVCACEALVSRVALAYNPNFDRARFLKACGLQS